MSHVSRSALRRFVDVGESTPEFEAHVDGCDVCAAALQRAAQVAVRDGSGARVAPAFFLGVPVEALLAFAAALLVLVAWPRPLPHAAQPLVLSSPGLAAAAGVPDAGLDEAARGPLLVAALDAGGPRD